MSLILKYRMMNSFGADYKSANVDSEEFIEILAFNFCLDQEAKMMEMRQKIQQGYIQMGVTPIH